MSPPVATACDRESDEIGWNASHSLGYGGEMKRNPPSPKGERDSNEPRQLLLDLPSEPRFLAEDFVVGPSNERAYAMIEA